MSEGNPLGPKVHDSDEIKYGALLSIFDDASDQLRCHQPRLLERLQAGKFTSSDVKNMFIATAISVRIELRKSMGLSDIVFSADESTARSLDFYYDRNVTSGTPGMVYATVKGRNDAGEWKTVLGEPFSTSKEKAFPALVGHLEEFANRYKQAVDGVLAWEKV